MTDPIITFPMFGDGFRLDFPSSFTIFNWTVHWYGVIIALGFLLATIYAIKRSKIFGLTEDNIIDVLLFGVVPAILGARIYYVIFEWDAYKDNLLSIFQIWNGGLAIYGGVIGCVIGILIFAKVKKVKITPTLDVVSLGLLIGQAVGRWGNFTNREAMSEKLTGSALSLPWKMGLVTSSGTSYYHPCFLYESIWNVIGLIILHFVSKKRKYDGQIFLMYLVWYGLGRVWIEGLRGDSLYIAGTNLRVSQLVALLCVVVGGIILIANAVSRHHEPEDMWVNRNMRKVTVEDAPAADPEEFDEELSDAFRILTKKDVDTDFYMPPGYYDVDDEPAEKEAPSEEIDIAENQEQEDK